MDSRVDVEVQQEEERFGRWAAVDSASDSTSSDESALLKSFADPNHKLVEQVYAHLRREDGQSAKGVKVVVPFYLTGEMIEVATRLFPTLTFESVSRAKQKGTIMELVRLGVQELSFRLGGEVGDEVIVYGGSVVSTVMRRRDYIHHCVNYSDMRKQAEHLSELEVVHKFLQCTPDARNRLAIACTSGDEQRSRIYCKDPRECKRVCDMILVDHCHNNIPPMQEAFGIAQHDAFRSQGFIYFDRAMLTEVRGVFSDMKAAWHIDKEADVVTVTSLEDSTVMWVHSYKSWHSWVTGAAVNVMGTQYTWEAVSELGGFLLYKMNRHTTVPLHDTVLRYSRYGKLIEPMVDIHFFEPVKSVVTGKPIWEKRVVRWPRALCDKVCRKAGGLPEKEFTAESLFRFVRDCNHIFVTSGSSVSRPQNNVLGQTEVDGITAIYNMYFQRRFEANEATKEMVAAGRRMLVATRTDTLALAKLVMEQRMARVTEWFGQLSVSKVASWFGVEGFSHTDVIPFIVDVSDRDDFEVIIPRTGQHPEDGREWAVTIDRGFPSPVAVTGWVNDKNRRKMFAAALAKSMAARKGSAESNQAVRAQSIHVPVSDVAVVPATLNVVKVDNDVGVIKENESDLGGQVLDKLTQRYDLGVSYDRKAFAEEHLWKEEVLKSKGPEISFESGMHGFIQEYLDGTIAKAISEDFSARSAMMHLDDQDLSVNTLAMAVNVSKMTLPPVTSVLRSNIRAAVEADRPQTTLETFVAYNKRCNDVPRLRAATDPRKQADNMWSWVQASGLMVSGIDRLLQEWADDPIQLDRQATDEWIKNASVNTLKELLAGDVNRADLELNRYQLMIKSTPKPKVDSDGSRDYQALQTVVYHQKAVNALFSPVFRKVTERFLSLWSPQVIIQIRKSAQEMNMRIKEQIEHTGGIRGAQYMESDIGKCDKSQDQVSHCFMYLLYEKLGMDSELLALWDESTLFGSVVSVSAGIKAEMAYQCQSGTAPTALRNTAFCTFSNMWAYKLDRSNVKFYAGMGDDMLVSLVQKEMIDLQAGVDDLAYSCNFQSKAFFSDVGYICSMYVVPDFREDCERGSGELMRDPFKQMVALGRPIKINQDVNAESLIVEKWVSFKDVTYNYDDAALLQSLASCVDTRVKNDNGTSSLGAIEALVGLRNNYSAFRATWADKPDRFAA